MPVTEAIIVGATPTSPDRPNTIFHSGAGVLVTSAPKIGAHAIGDNLSLPDHPGRAEAGDALAGVAPTLGSEDRANRESAWYSILDLLRVDLLKGEVHPAGGD
jgi:hypothetical protein